MTPVLVDTSVWVAHFRQANPTLQALLQEDRVMCHPWVILEVACGTPPSPRQLTLEMLQLLQPCPVATLSETLALIGLHQLHDSGCGAIDLALLASVLIAPPTRLWTLDKSLQTLAHRLGVAHVTPPH